MRRPNRLLLPGEERGQRIDGVVGAVCLSLFIGLGLVFYTMGWL